eukprot:SAG31_NODE_1378_length_8588_cov_2.424382_1_plen_64_part_10
MPTLYRYCGNTIVVYPPPPPLGVPLSSIFYSIPQNGSPVLDKGTGTGTGAGQKYWIKVPPKGGG